MTTWISHLRIAGNLLVYQNQPEEHPDAFTRPYLYLSKLEMDEFVIAASDQLEQVYRILWPVAPDITRLNSALQLLEGNPS